MDRPSEAEAFRPAALTLPRAFLTRHMGMLILLLALGGVATQMLAIIAGRDFVFGLVPKFNPAGSRNIPTWFGSALLAACAAAAGVAAAAIGTARRTSSRWWWYLAASLAVLSAERMAAMSRGLQQVLEALDARSAASMASFIAVTAAVAIYARCIRDVPKASRQHFALGAAVFALGAAVCSTAAGGRLSGDVRLARAFLMSAGRVLELSGLTLLLGAVVAWIRSLSPHVLVTIDRGTSTMVAAHREGDVLELRISPSRVSRVLAGITVALLAVSLSAAILRALLAWEVESLYRLFFVDFEGNVPTWFSSLLLLACGAVAAAIAATSHHRGDRMWPRWTLLALVFVALSADEAASFHEMTVLPLRALLGNNPWLRYPLILPGALATIAGGVIFAGFLRAIPPETSRALLAGGSLFLFGALVLELIGGWFDPLVRGENLTYLLLATVEEACEMGGGIVLLAALMRHIERAIGPLELPNG